MKILVMDLRFDELIKEFIKKLRIKNFFDKVLIFFLVKL